MTIPLTSTCKMTAIEAYQQMEADYDATVQHCLDVIRDCDDPEVRLHAAQLLRHVENSPWPRSGK